MMVWWLAYIGLGAFAGFFAGLLGIGGGSVMVPILVMLFAAQGFPSGDVMHLALGTSMAAIFYRHIQRAYAPCAWCRAMAYRCPNYARYRDRDVDWYTNRQSGTDQGAGTDFYHFHLLRVGADDPQYQTEAAS